MMRRLNTFVIEGGVFRSMVEIRIKIFVMRKKTPRISKLALDRTYLITEPPFTNSADKKLPQVSTSA